MALVLPFQCATTAAASRSVGLSPPRTRAASEVVTVHGRTGHLNYECRANAESIEPAEDAPAALSRTFLGRVLYSELPEDPEMPICVVPARLFFPPKLNRKSAKQNRSYEAMLKQSFELIQAHSALVLWLEDLERAQEIEQRLEDVGLASPPALVCGEVGHSDQQSIASIYFQNETRRYLFEAAPTARDKSVARLRESTYGRWTIFRGHLEDRRTACIEILGALGATLRRRECAE